MWPNKTSLLIEKHVLHSKHNTYNLPLRNIERAGYIAQHFENYMMYSSILTCMDSSLCLPAKIKVVSCGPIITMAWSSSLHTRTGMSDLVCIIKQLILNLNLPNSTLVTWFGSDIRDATPVLNLLKTGVTALDLPILVTHLCAPIVGLYHSFM